MYKHIKYRKRSNKDITQTSAAHGTQHSERASLLTLNIPRLCLYTMPLS